MWHRFLVLVRFHEEVPSEICVLKIQRYGANHDCQGFVDRRLFRMEPQRKSRVRCSVHPIAASRSSFRFFSANNQSTECDMHQSNVPTTENTNPSNLMLIWKDITYALISSGHGAVLHQELNTSSRTGHAPNDQESCRVVARSDQSQSLANNAENNRWTNEFDSGEESTVSSLDESDADEDIYDDLLIPSYIIHEAADLSQCRACPTQDFEDICPGAVTSAI